ncbi:MAG: hypothetical protein EXX96DRAFT_524508 [Benjaminiella poitrasii]|nr:MAG: hypothetical protein EXX96DRAFT_524508 [Benjaminiella poitrasii]
MAFLSRLSPYRLIKPHSQTRSIWTRLTATGANIHDCIEQSVQILDRKTPNVCVVLASKSFTLNNYRDLTRQLNLKLNTPAVLLGGVIDRIPHFDHGISLLLGFDEHVVPFTIRDNQQRLKIRNTAVGRWGRVEDVTRLKYQNDHLDHLTNWDDFGSINIPVQPFQLPPGFDDSKQPSFLFTVSDNEPEQLLQTLDHHYADVPKLGLVGASTPFVTGDPYCLFHGEEMMGSGMVGFAAYTKNAPSEDVIVSHTAMEKLGEPMRIARCQGNVILDLEAGGATGLLLQLIQKSGPLSKDEEFYAGVYPLDDQADENMTASRITSGDPSRGNMSIDTTADLQVGQVIQFLRKKAIDTNNVSSDHANNEAIVFGVSGKDDTIDATPVKIPTQASVIEDCFGGISENGIIVGRKNMPSELLNVPFSKATFKL